MVLNLLGNDVLPGGALDQAAEIRRQEVMDRPIPPAHARSHRLLLDVLAEGRALLGHLGVVGRGDVASRVQRALVAFEEHLLAELAEEPSHASVHGLFLSLFG